MLRGRTKTEFLIDIQDFKDMKKEFVLDPKDEKYLPVSYKYNRHTDGFFVFNVYSNDFQKNRARLEKQKTYKLVITEIQWNLSGIELKPSDGPKITIECQIIDIRKNFFEVKIIS